MTLPDGWNLAAPRLYVRRGAEVIRCGARWYVWLDDKQLAEEPGHRTLRAAMAWADERLAEEAAP